MAFLKKYLNVCLVNNHNKLLLTFNQFKSHEDDIFSKEYKKLPQIEPDQILFLFYDFNSSLLF